MKRANMKRAITSSMMEMQLWMADKEGRYLATLMDEDEELEGGVGRFPDLTSNSRRTLIKIDFVAKQSWKINDNLIGFGHMDKLAPHAPLWNAALTSAFYSNSMPLQAAGLVLCRSGSMVNRFILPKLGTVHVARLAEFAEGYG
jgi:hypothetical protein